MDGYKIIYKEPDGTTTATFFGEPVLNFCLPNSSNMEVVMQFLLMHIRVVKWYLLSVVALKNSWNKKAPARVSKALQGLFYAWRTKALDNMPIKAYNITMGRINPYKQNKLRCTLWKSRTKSNRRPLRNGHHPPRNHRFRRRPVPRNRRRHPGTGHTGQQPAFWKVWRGNCNQGIQPMRQHTHLPRILPRELVWLVGVGGVINHVKTYRKSKVWRKQTLQTVQN